MATVALRGVSKTYAGGTVAVQQVNLEVAEGEFVVLVGPSGCGKTSTLRMIAGLEEVTAGEIRIGERVVNRVPPKDRNIAMVFQNYALYPHMNVYRNMAFGLELRYRSDWLSRIWLALTQPKLAAELAEKRQGITNRVKETAEMLGIGQLLQRKPGQLSGGEKQRVALGRAIVRQPAAFLFDEPLSNLDAQLRGEMRRELRRLHSELKATMIYVTHDQVEAMTLGDRIVVMNRGEVCQVGTPLEVYDSPQNRFVAQFLGSPPMNFMEGRVQASGSGAEFVSSHFRLEIPHNQLPTSTLPERKITLGVRPEDVQLNSATGIPARFDSLEPLGDSTLVHLQLGSEPGVPLTARLRDRITQLTRGEEARVAFDPQRLHWFDTDTEERLNMKK